MWIVRINDWLENLYNQYKEKESEIMLDYFTDRLWDIIYSEDHCRSIIDELKKKFPYDKEKIENINTTDYMTALQHISSNNWEEYTALSIQYYLWLRDLSKSPFYSNPYYQEIVWVNVSGNSPSANAYAFKTDFIRPIIDYIESKLSSPVIVLNEIKRYKMRTERFSIVGKELDDIKEKDLQNDIALH